MKSPLSLISLIISLSTLHLIAAQPADHLVLEAADGPGKGKHIVFLTGDEEYRSEEALPMMAQIMAKQGFKCTVLFSLNDQGIVDPINQKSLAHSESLDSADAIVMLLRFRNWDDVSMTRFDNAILRGIPIIALRTSTHAFKFPSDSKWAKYSFNAKHETGWHKGFGKQILGETWVNHHGKHKKEATRSVIEAANKSNDILKSVGTIFCTTDVYGAHPPADATILLRGEVTQSFDPKSKPVSGKKNSPMMPIAWTRNYKNTAGKTNKILTTTMGAASDLVDENLRRLIANGIYWALNLPVPVKTDVTLPGEYNPTFYSFGTFKKGLKPADFLLTPVKKKL